MNSVLDRHRQEIAALCRRFGVRRLELFGSGTSRDFDPQSSDLDFLVDFGADGDQDLFHRYFGLKLASEFESRRAGIAKICVQPGGRCTLAALSREPR